jgi:hypothetical protein
MSGLTNRQVENFGKKYLGKHFLGVYPSDGMPSVKNLKNTSIIFNLSKHTEPGSHFVAVYFNDNNIYYFDSYGKKLTNYFIKKNLKKFNVPIFYHTRPIQHNDSIFCGFYALAYLKSFQQQKAPPLKFYNLFKYPANKTNDKIVIDFLLK